MKRYKHAKKVLSFYKNTFGYREPFQVLVDGTFCQAALKGKIYIKEQLPKYFGSSVQLVTTRCIAEEIRSLGQDFYGASLVAQRFSHRNCGHTKKCVNATECVLSMIGENNSSHFVVASQDKDVQEKLRLIPGVALVHIVRNTIVLESPSEESHSKADELVESVTDLTHHEKTVVEALDKEIEQHEVQKRKRKKPHGPNPLSVKKKAKSHAPVLTAKTSSKNQRRRARQKKLKVIKHLSTTVKV